MHFLAHFHLQPPTYLPQFYFGNMLPDLVPGFTKVYHQRLKHSNVLLSNGEQAFHAGINTHFKDDKLFHSNKYFEETCRAFTRLLVSKQLDRSTLRLSFMAHILVEILLDRWLCEQQPKLPSRFYEMLEHIDTSELKTYLDKHSLPQVVELAAQKRNRFLEHRFLNNLSESEQIAIGVCKLYERITNRIITNYELFRIIETINEFYAQNNNWNALLIR